ncbi:trypsin-like peptidase domain-containing protein [Micromonospora saelicesensis]|uniref:nSTAND1 domain-containing NTPase n=1 Tax=Micromonospora saelicesensis TaxID=285676 RepID=UPI003D922DD0
MQVLAGDGTAVGAGFVVGTDLLLTCAHVVLAADSGPGQRVTLRFSQLDGAPEISGQVLAEAWRESDGDDVAVVRVESIPSGAAILPLGAASGCRGHAVRSFGFPAQALTGGHYGYGVAGDLLRSGPGMGVLLQLSDANDMTQGFSGGPILDNTTGLVVGMLTAITRVDAHLRGSGVAYATTTEALREIWPALQLRDVCPYRGLDVFAAEHAAWFHGRADAIQRVTDGLAAYPPAMLLLGPSGAGKSSLIHAGVLPALAHGDLPGSDQWISVVTRPGPDLPALIRGDSAPAARGSIAAAVADRLTAQPSGCRLVLVIDQFEDLLTPSADAEQDNHLAIVRQIAEAIGTPRLSVVLLMRDDFYPRLAALAPGLLDTVAAGLVNIPATLTRQDLHDIINKPAEAVGARCQEGLAERIIADVLAVDPRADVTRHAHITVLPLLEVTLQQLWRRRDDGFLTHDAYQRIGGVTGGLTGWCDAVIDELSDGQRAIAERILTALVRPADDARHIPAVRQQVSLTVLRDLADTKDPAGRQRADPVFDQVLTALTSHRIVTTRVRRSSEDPDGIPVAELVHDALIRDWGALGDWVSRDHRFQDWLRRAEDRRLRWTRSRASDDLLHGTDLAEGLDWRIRRRLPQDLAVFMASSHRQQQARDRRARRLNAVLAALLVVVVTAASIAWWQRQTAVNAELLAVSRQLAAQSTSMLSTDPDLASLLAVHAYRTSPTSEAATSLYAAAAHPLLHRLTGHTKASAQMAFSPDGLTLASTGGRTESVRVWDVASGRTSSVLAHPGGASSVAFSPDGRTLATTGGRKGVLRLWEVASGQLRSMFSPPERVTWALFSPDGRDLVTRGGDFGETLRLWDVTGGQSRVLTDEVGFDSAVAFGPDGRSVISSHFPVLFGAGQGIAQSWDVGSGRVREVAIGHVASSPLLTFSPDGRVLANIGRDDGTVGLWDVASERNRTVTIGITDAPSAIALSPGGHTLATADADGTLRLWDMVSGQSRAVLIGHTSEVTAMLFSPDGSTLASADENGTMRWWDVASGHARHELTDYTQVGAIAFSPEGHTLVIAGRYDGAIRLWDVVSGHPRKLLNHAGGVFGVAFSPDGRTLASGGGKSVRLWDVTSGRALKTLTGHTGAATSVAFSPDGRTLASADGVDGTVRLWDVSSGRATGILSGHDLGVIQVVFSPDGRTLASVNENAVWLWDVASGDVRTVLTDHTGSVTEVAFSPDGGTLASASAEDRTIRLWDASSGHPRRVLEGPGGVGRVAFSPDGRTLVGAGSGTVRLWDVASGTAGRILAGDVEVFNLAISPDNVTLATVGRNGVVRLWGRVFPNQSTAMDKICGSVVRNLTKQERKAYLPAPSFSAAACPHVEPEEPSQPPR